MNRFNSIEIKGGYFDNSCRINFYKMKKRNGSEELVNGRVVLIYGENGAGKSNIAKAISGLNDEKSEYLVNFFSNEKLIKDYRLDPNNIFVYDEKFIDGKVKYGQKNLNAIVMFGEQVEVDNKIEKLSEDLKKLEEKLERENENLEKIEDEENKLFNSLRGILRKDGGWADLEKQIQEKAQKPPVTKNNIDEIFEFHEKVSESKLSELKDEFQTKFSLFKNQIRENVKSLKKIPIPSIDHERIEGIVNLLKTEYKQPIEDNTLTWLEEQLRIRGVDFYYDVKNFMELDDTEQCPFCLQKVNSDHKETVLSQLNKILGDSIKDLNEKIDKHIDFLEKSEIKKIKIDEYKNLGNNPIKNLQIINEKITEFNKSLVDLINNLKKKKDKPFMNIESKPPKLEVEDKVRYINELVEEYNENLENIEKTKRKLSLINKKIVALEYGSQYKVYKDKKEEFEIIELDNKMTRENIEKIKSKISEYTQQKKNTKIALELINDYLSFIFWDKNRLKLKPSEDAYEVWSKGVHVELSKLSIAERNIISLCYFFSKLKEERELKDRSPKFIIIDDPVSSFDSQNKVGIISFLKSRLKELLEENSSNKIILLTHDIYSMLQIKKSLEDIKSQLNSKNDVLYLTYQLHDKQLKSLNFNKYNYMTELICTSAYFAFGEESDHLGINIGNMLRRVIEGFSSFNYKYDVTEIFNKPEIVGKLDAKRIEYYQDKMYRLFLHGESHLDDQIRTGLGNENELFISLDEKKNLSKDILCFIYELDELFIKRHLDSITNFTNNKLHSGKVLKGIREHLEKLAVKN